MEIVIRRRRTRKIRVEDNKVVFKKLKEHVIELPQEVIEFVKKNIRILQWLVYDSPISSYLRHPGAVKSLILLLYSRVSEKPITVVAKEAKTFHEQLYRIERRLKELRIEEVYKYLVK